MRLWILKITGSGGRRVLLVWVWTSSCCARRFLTHLADTSVHSKTTRQDARGASPLPLGEAGVLHGCLALSSWEASLGGGLGNAFTAEGIQPIFCRVFVVEAGSCSGCTKEKGSCCNKAMLCLGRTLAAAEEMEGRC